MLKRLAVFLLALVGFLLVSEGVLSLFLGESWSRLLRGRSFLEKVAEPLVQTDVDRFAAAARTPGPYRIHADPRVGYVLKSEAELELMRATVRTDHLGLRRRPGPTVTDDAFQVVVLGDSVAFGWGIEDDEVLAARLEKILRRERKPDEPEIVCRTVAIPSWNTRNAASFLLDHLDRLEPDLVLYMHVPNDLNDCFGVYETGHRRAQPDLCSPDPLVHVGGNMQYIRRAVQRLQEAGVALADVDAGLDVMPAGLSPASSGRIDAMARTLIELQARLAERNAPLILLPFTQHDLHRQLRLRLSALEAHLPAIALLDKIQEEDTLGFDPHPSAETVRAMAIWTARSLIERRLVPRAGMETLPTVPARLAGRRARELSAEELAAWRTEYATASLAGLAESIEHESVRGVRQIYGGLRLDGSMGPVLLALLPPGRTLRVELAPLPGAPSLYPQDVRVQVDGQELGALTLRGDEVEPVSAEFDLPSDVNAAPVEVRLEAERWVLAQVYERSTLVSVRFVSLSVGR